MTDTTPKTKKSVRRIPLSQNAKEALLSIKANKTVKPADYISQTKTGKPASARNVQRSMGKVLKQLNIPNYKNYSLHSLRHTFVSMLIAQKTDIKIISELLGHEKVSTTYNIYAHLMPMQKEQSIMALDNLDEMIRNQTQ